MTKYYEIHICSLLKSYVIMESLLLCILQQDNSVYVVHNSHHLQVSLLNGLRQIMVI